VAKLKETVRTAPPPPPSRWPDKSSTFEWTFTSAGRVAKTIGGLGSTEALGHDRVRVSIYKKGVDVLSGPIAHLVNRSLANGVFPNAWKVGIMVPTHKGGGKSRSDPASYRPVSLLCALSKVLELVVKNALQKHLDISGNVPSSQHGFRRGRSCTSAIAAAHAAWTGARRDGKVVGILCFDMSAAFDLVVGGSTVTPSDRLTLLGVTFDRTLSVAPHSEMVAVAARQRVGIVARLAHHVPRGAYLRQLAMGLVNGKVLHALAALAVPRLQDPGGSTQYKSVKIAFNDLARTLTGTRRTEHVRVEELLQYPYKLQNLSINLALLFFCASKDYKDITKTNHLRTLCQEGRGDERASWCGT
jgi:hypothetical protein